MNALNCKALTAGAAAALAVVAGIWLGSRALTHFDPALIWYATGSVLAAFALAYRFAVWAQRPPTRLYFKRGLQLLFNRRGSRRGNEAEVLFAPKSASSRRRLPFLNKLPRLLKPPHVNWKEPCNPFATPSASLTLGHAIATDFAAQNFIRRRGVYRWIMHVCLSGGCTLAFAITFPLVFGWVHFEPGADNAEVYRVQLLGFNAGRFNVHSVQAWLMFNLLNISAVLVMIGLALAGIRRLVNAGERAVQTFAEDILPLLLIFAVSASGLMLTVSYKLLSGRGHSQVAVFHTISVIALLFYIPFGKLFHMFQRTCALCVSLYKEAGATGPRAHCRGCGEDYASELHISDLKSVLDQLGFDYRFATPRGEAHYQDICPACRRRALALHQGRSLGR
jgi:hypothetical protein